MADVKVGQVRREKPRTVPISGEPAPVYVVKPFRVLAVECQYAIVVSTDGRGGQRQKLLSAVERCRFWPSEHRQWTDAQGYEVKT